MNFGDGFGFMGCLPCTYLGGEVWGWGLVLWVAYFVHTLVMNFGDGAWFYGLLTMYIPWW